MGKVPPENTIADYQAVPFTNTERQAICRAISTGEQEQAALDFLAACEYEAGVFLAAHVQVGSVASTTNKKQLKRLQADLTRALRSAQNLSTTARSYLHKETHEAIGLGTVDQEETHLESLRDAVARAVARVPSHRPANMPVAILARKIGDALFALGIVPNSYSKRPFGVVLRTVCAAAQRYAAANKIPASIKNIPSDLRLLVPKRQPTKRK